MDLLQIRDALYRIEREWIEMPQLKLTSRQAQRLWGLSMEICEAAFAALIERGFLVQAPDGSYMRRPFLRPGIASIEALVRAM